MNMMKSLPKKLLLLVFLCIGSIAYAQSIKGNVSDGSGPIPGANVVIKGTSTGTTSNADGNFEIAVNSGDVIVVSFLGYGPQEVAYSSQPVINVVLVEDISTLQEIVVTGYGGAIKKTDLTGSISQVSSKDFDKQPVFQVGQALQGRAAGVQLTQPSGAPGGAPKIRIRGANSLTGSNDPLIVVDNLIDVDLGSVNPNDIESINILKDASATAIYGNRGANGVIIIKTKNGGAGKTIVEFGTFMTFSALPGKINVMDGATYAETVNARNLENGSAAKFSDQQIAALKANGGTDWQKELLRTAMTKNYQVSLRGGDDKTNYFVSANYVDQEGSIINSSYERFNLRGNLNAKLNDKLSVNWNSLISREKGINNNESYIAKAISTWDPTTPIRDAEGAYNVRSTSNTGGIGENPVMLANERVLNKFENNIQTNLAFNYQIADGLSLNISGGAQYRSKNQFDFSPVFAPALSSASHDINDRLRWQNINRLTYTKNFGKQNLTVDAVYEQRQTEERGTNASGTGLASANVGYDNLAAATNKFISSSYGKRSLKAYLARAVYNYDSRYLVTGSVRLDQSSVFPNNKSGVFSALGLGWNISNESFFNVNAINQLKLRMGWGQTGNENIDSNAAFGLLSSTENDGYLINGTTISAGVGPSTRLANPDVKWETTTQLNLGLDIGLLDNLIVVSADVYKKNTTDLLLNRRPASYTGFSSQIVNAGEIQNKGVELSINAYPVNGKDFSWDFGFNLTANKSKVLKLVDGLDQMFLGAAYATSGNQSVSIVKVGESIGSFYGYVYEGVNATNGAAVYKDISGPDGVPDGVVNGDYDRTIIGNSTPKFTLGFNNTLKYKNFDFNVFFQGIIGNDVYNYQRGLTLGYSSTSPNATNPEILNAWRADNTTGTLPRQTSPWNDVSSFLIEDASFVRLKNLSLGYNITDGLTKRIGLTSARVYISAQNLFTITNYSGVDPEVSAPSDGVGAKSGSADIDAGVDNGLFPISKMYTVGLNIKF